MSAFDEVCRAVRSCEGYSLRLLSLSLVDDLDALEISLRWGPSKPDSVLSLRRIHFFAISRSPDDAAPFLEGISAQEIGPDAGTWPEHLMLSPDDRLPVKSLLWINVAGGIRLDVVAAQASVLQQIA